MIVIIPDTNILHDSPLLVSPEWQSLIQHSDDWQVQIVVPDVVLMETVNVVRRKWEAEQQKLDALRVGAFDLETDVKAIRDEIQRRIDGYEVDLKDRLASIGARILPVPQVGHLEIANRASRRIPPYQGGTKDGYRDTLIWLTVMAVGEEYAEHETWFVSNNHKDFGPKPGDWTGPNKGSQSDCPIQFHGHLAKELEERGISERVKFVTSLSSLEQHLAALHGPISAEELSLLTASLDFNALNHILNMMALGRKITPSETALNPMVTHAMLKKWKTKKSSWVFTDAARRGEGRWTANFTADVEAEIITATDTNETAVVTKILRLSGFVNFKEPSEFAGLSVSTVSSLPDDPDRALWETPPAAYWDVINATGTFNGPGIADIMKTAGTFSGPSIADIMKTAGTFDGPSIADIMKTAGTFDGPSIADIIKTAGTFDGPSIADIITRGIAEQTGEVEKALEAEGSTEEQDQDDHGDSPDDEPDRH